MSIVFLLWLGITVVLLIEQHAQRQARRREDAEEARRLQAERAHWAAQGAGLLHWRPSAASERLWAARVR